MPPVLRSGSVPITTKVNSVKHLVLSHVRLSLPFHFGPTGTLASSAALSWFFSKSRKCEKPAERFRKPYDMLVSARQVSIVRWYKQMRDDQWDERSAPART